MTLNQKPGDCINENISCVKDTDCDDLPSIFVSPAGESSTCQVLYKKNKTDVKACKVYTWCPRQNPNKKRTTWILYREAFDVSLIAHCDRCDSLLPKSDKSSNPGSLRQFPAQGANIFRVKELVKASGMDLDQVQSIGGGINLLKTKRCFKMLGYISCSQKLQVFPLEYFGESLGYLDVRTNNLRMFKDTRNEHQMVGLNVSFDMVLEIDDFSPLRFCLFFSFFYLLDCAYKRIIFSKCFKK